MSPFVNGALFWGGIGLVSIPIIIHLITRRRFKRLEWAAMEYLLEALRRNRRRIRLEQLLLLLLRIALVALIVLAVSRPHLSQDRYNWLSGPFQSEEKVFLVDDSQSMSHIESGRSSLQRGAEAILLQLEKIAKNAGRDPVTLARASRFQAPLVNGAQINAERLENLRRQLTGGASLATATRLDLAAALEHLAATAHPERGRVVSIITDLCAADWTDGQGARGGPQEPLARALERLTGDKDHPVRVLVLDSGSRNRANLAITRFALGAANPIAGIAAELDLEVTNFGRESSRGAGVRIRSMEAAGAVLPGPRLPDLPPGETARLKIPYTFSRAGPAALAAELEGNADGLSADDRRFLVVEVLEAVEVLVVDGEPSGVPGEGETDFLVQALRPEGEMSSGYAPLVVVEANLPSENLGRFSAIILANLAAVPDGFARLAGEFVRNGGGLIIFAGDLVDSRRYEKALGIDAQGLLPARLGDVAGNPERPVHMEPQLDHPAFRLLAGAGDELLRLLEVGKFIKLAPLPNSRIVARLTDPDASPLIVEKQVGKGKVVLFAVPPDLEWTNWPRNPSFLPVILELVASIARPPESAWNRLAGAPVEVPLDLARFQREARLRAPDYPSSPERKLLASVQAAPATAGFATGPSAAAQTSNSSAAAPAAGNGAGGAAPETRPPAAGQPEAEAGDRPAEAAAKDFHFTIEDTRQGGIYSLHLKSISGEESVRPIAINADPGESDLTVIEPEALKKLYPGIPFEIIRDPAAFSEPTGGRFEIADALLWIFLIVLFTEGTLAWWFAHHQ